MNYVVVENLCSGKLRANASKPNEPTVQQERNFQLAKFIEQREHLTLLG